MTAVNQKVVERCLAELKIALRAKGIKYANLAELMDVSEVTVKRMLNQSDIGLERLISLAEIAGLNAAELLQTAINSPQPHYYFTDIQDKAFHQNKHLYHYFSELFYYKKTPEQIQQENKISDISTYRYLRKLEDIELIELQINNKFTFRAKAPLGFSANSLVLKEVITQHIQATCDAVMSSNSDPSFFMRVKPMRAPESFYLEMADELKKVVDRYTGIAESAFSHKEELPTFQVTVVGHPFELTDVELEPIVDVDSCL
ncbi:MAG: helix-turn-helix transcriptional regulator [Gammaproteobacteria bacterium]|nr:helix-turn-helix transcriptional regulator [Gammaproteobacteria bacterium]